jgi:hypothetical protein
MLPPIQEPWPYQSPSAGPPNCAARSSSEMPNSVLQKGGSSNRVKSITCSTLGASSAWV